MMTRRVKLGIALLVGLVAGILVGVFYARQTVGTTFGWMSQSAAFRTYAQLLIFNTNIPMRRTQGQRYSTLSASQKNFGMRGTSRTRSRMNSSSRLPTCAWQS